MAFVAQSSGDEPFYKEGEGAAFEPATNGVYDKDLAQRILRIKWIYLFNLFTLIWLSLSNALIVVTCQVLLNSNLLTPHNSMWKIFLWSPFYRWGNMGTERWTGWGLIAQQCWRQDLNPAPRPVLSTLAPYCLPKRVLKHCTRQAAWEGCFPSLPWFWHKSLWILNGRGNSKSRTLYFTCPPSSIYSSFLYVVFLCW